MLIGDGERIAIHPVAHRELAFEVRRPQIIRFSRVNRDDARMHNRPAAPPGPAKGMALEEIGHRTDRRPDGHRGRDEYTPRIHTIAHFGYKRAAPLTHLSASGAML